MGISRHGYGILIELVRRERGNMQDDMRRCEMEMNRLPHHLEESSGLQQRWREKHDRELDLNALEMKLETEMNTLPLSTERV